MPPPEQKFAAFRYIIHRLTNYSTNNENKGKEYDTIIHILHTNKFNTHHLNNIVSKLKPKTPTQKTEEAQDT